MSVFRTIFKCREEYIDLRKECTDLKNKYERLVQELRENYVHVKHYNKLLEMKVNELLNSAEFKNIMRDYLMYALENIVSSVLEDVVADIIDVLSNKLSYEVEFIIENVFINKKKELVKDLLESVKSSIIEALKHMLGEVTK